MGVSWDFRPFRDYTVGISRKGRGSADGPGSRGRSILKGVSGPAAVVSPSVIDLTAVQAALKADGIDAWLLYDFRGLNPIALEITGVALQGGHLLHAAGP